MYPDDKAQTVTEDQPAADAPNEGTEAQTEATGAQDTTDPDWDALLSDSQPEPDKPKPEPEESDRLKVVEAKYEKLENFITKKDTTEGLETAVQGIKAAHEVLGGLSDRVVEGFIYAISDKNPQIDRAFKNRHQNPKAWEKAQGMIGKEMASDFADMPDADLTAGVEAAVNAVRGVSNKTPAAEEHENKFYAKMTDVEFKAQCDKELEATGG